MQASKPLNPVMIINADLAFFMSVQMSCNPQSFNSRILESCYAGKTEMNFKVTGVPEEHIAEVTKGLVVRLKEDAGFNCSLISENTIHVDWNVQDISSSDSNKLIAVE